MNQSMHFFNVPFVLAILLFPASLPAAEVAARFGGATPLEWSVRLANSEVARRSDSLEWKEGGTAKWDYAAGLFALSLLELNRVAPHSNYVACAEGIVGSFLAPDGTIHKYKVADYNLDNVNPGRAALELWKLTGDAKYKRCAMLLREQLKTQPRTSDGGFWHKQRYPHQMWLDGVYMASPFYAEYGALFHEPEDFDDVAKQIRLAAAHTGDPASGLFYHGWDESKEQDWADKSTGTSSNFWGRAMGWYAMACVDVLDWFPTNHPARPEIITTLRRVVNGIVKFQDPESGLWWQVLDQPGRDGNYLEATASSMFVYTMAKGVNRGYLPADSLAAAEKGYRGIVTRLIRTGDDGTISLTHCCSVAGLGYGRDGSYRYYVGEPVVENDLKGVGPFILAGIELSKR